MINNYVLIALRQMIKNKLFISINVVGMAIAVACCTVAYYLHEFNSTFDTHHANSPSIYRISSIREFQNKLTKYGHVPQAMGRVIQGNQGDIEKVVRYNTATINTRVKDLVFNDVVAFVDPSFFTLFTFETLQGSLSLDEKSSIILSEEFAIKYFGDANPIGKEIIQLLDSGKTKPFTVAGVFKKQPNNSSFIQQAYLHFENLEDAIPDFDENNWSNRSLLYVQILDKSRVKPVENQLAAYTINNNLAREDFIIKNFVVEPFSGLAKNDSYNNTHGVWTNSAAHISAVVGTAAMGIFILLIACFNLTNTAIAVSARRLKEIGIRKVMGSNRRNIIEQYMGEIFLICLLSFFAGLLISHFLLIPAFNSLWSFWAFTPDYFSNPDFLIFSVAILLCTSLLAGSYPAFYISKFRPVEILKGKLKFGGTNAFTGTLLTLQLMISLAAIVCSLAFIANARYQQSLDMGFNKNEVIYTAISNTLEFESLKTRLLQHPDIRWVAGSVHHIGSSYFNDPIKSADKELEVDILDIGDDYLKTAGLTLLEGRDFTKDSETDKHESVIITENMATAFGWNKAIGQEILWMDTTRYTVIGVVKNIVNKGMMNRMDPVMLRYTGNRDTKFCLVNAPVEKIAAVKKVVEGEVKELFPDRIATVKYMNELIANSLQINTSILKMFVFLGFVAMFLSATGLYTLTSLNIVKRLKEIGMRKILGAKAGNIIRVINKEFFIILGIAAILGGLLGSWMASILLDSIWEHFERTTMLTIIYSVAILVTTSVLSIALKIYSTIRINPATILRSE